MNLRGLRGRVRKTEDGWWQAIIPGYRVQIRLVFTTWRQCFDWTLDKLREIRVRGWVDSPWEIQ